MQTQQVSLESQISFSTQTYTQDMSVEIPIILRIFQNSQQAKSFKEELGAFQKKVREFRYVIVRIAVYNTDYQVIYELNYIFLPNLLSLSHY